jgi:hypothetical protein
MSSRGTPLTLLTIDIEDCYFFPSNIHNPVKPLDQHLLLAFIRLTVMTKLFISRGFDHLLTHQRYDNTVKRIPK